jgi:hypothetical protein
LVDVTGIEPANSLIQVRQQCTVKSHFPGDAFFGGAMGFVIARYVVLPVR